MQIKLPVPTMQFLVKKTSCEVHSYCFFFEFVCNYLEKYVAIKDHFSKTDDRATTIATIEKQSFSDPFILFIVSYFALASRQLFPLASLAFSFVK